MRRRVYPGLAVRSVSQAENSASPTRGREKSVTSIVTCFALKRSAADTRSAVAAPRPCPVISTLVVGRIKYPLSEARRDTGGGESRTSIMAVSAAAPWLSSAGRKAVWTRGRRDVGRMSEGYM